MVALPEPLLSRLREVREVLMFTFDFEMLEQPLDSEAYATPSPWLPAFIVPGASTAIVGRDATGGVYVCCEFSHEHTRCLHIDTRGHAVPLGENVEQALALLVALPYWHQLLIECPSGKLDVKRELAGRLEQEVCDDLPALPPARNDLQRFLELPMLADPIRRLHELTVAPTEPVTVLSPHGWRYESPVAAARAGAGGDA
jgi:hypothetical protein